MALANRRTDVPYVQTRTAIVCSLTGRRYGFDPYSAKSKNEALDKHAEEAGQLRDATEQRIGRKLSLRELKAAVDGKFLPDERPMRQRIFEDSIVRDNSEPNLGNQIRNGLRGCDPNHRTFRSSKARQEALQRLEAMAQQEDDMKAAKAADEARREDPVFQRALEHAQATARLVAGDPESTESEIAAARDRLMALEAQWTGAAYWAALELSEADTRPADKEAELQRAADAATLQNELRKRKDEIK